VENALPIKCRQMIGLAWLASFYWLHCFGGICGLTIARLLARKKEIMKKILKALKDGAVIRWDRYSYASPYLIGGKIIFAYIQIGTFVKLQELGLIQQSQITKNFFEYVAG